MTAPFLLMVVSILAADEFKPKWGDAVIEVAGQEIKPLRILPDWTFEYKVGKRRFTVVGDAVTEVDPTTGKKQWTATAEDHGQLVWLDANETTAFFVVEPDNSDEAANQDGGESTIRRLDLETHRWLSPLLLPKAEPEGEQSRLTRNVVGQLLAGKSETVVLVFSTSQVGLFSGMPGWPRPKDKDNSLQGSRSYRVCCFAAGETNPKWVKPFAWSGRLKADSCHLYSTNGPQPSERKVRYLSRLGDGALLICAGEKQDVLALHLDTGDEQWRIERIWEYERAFIGPSVFEYYMTRFGLDPDTAETAAKPPNEDATKQELEYYTQAKATVAKSQKDFDENYEASILAGPLVTTDRSTAFVAVAHSRKGQWSGLLSDTTVYQLAAHGGIDAAAKLPRMIEGWPQRALKQGVVWACEAGGLVHLGIAEPDFSHGFRMTEDLLCRVRWYREYPFRRENAWLSSDAQPGAAAISDGHVVRTLDGGYIRKKEDQVFRFPINAVRLSNPTFPIWAEPGTDPGSVWPRL